MCSVLCVFVFCTSVVSANEFCYSQHKLFCQIEEKLSVFSIFTALGVGMYHLAKGKITRVNGDDEVIS